MYVFTLTALEFYAVSSRFSDTVLYGDDFNAMYTRWLAALDYKFDEDALSKFDPGEFSDMWEARRVIRNSFDIKEYTPNADMAGAWDEAYGRFCKLL